MMRWYYCFHSGILAVRLSEVIKMYLECLSFALVQSTYGLKIELSAASMRHNQNDDKNVRWLKRISKRNMSFQLSSYSLRRIENNVYARKGEIKIIKRTKAGDHCLKSILHWFGIGLELLSVCLVAELCQASKVFLMREEGLCRWH